MDRQTRILRCPSMSRKNNDQLRTWNSKVRDTRFSSKNESRRFLGLQSQTESLAGENHSYVSIHPERHRHVDLNLIRTGLLHFHLLLQCCPPGSVPDPQFLNNLLFLVGLVHFIPFYLTASEMF